MNIYMPIFSLYKVSDMYVLVTTNIFDDMYISYISII